ncbi:hypothetical protein Pres01_27850 [Metapseudomonas resinovorans]|nr:hypothetical protein Pres01_27850 [Pseudomonas resinovorans]
MQHLALPLLAGQGQRWRGDHVAEPRQAPIEGAARQLEEEVGMALTGGRIDLAALGQDEGNQALSRGEVGAAEKNQVFEEVRQAGIRLRSIMASSMYPQGGSGPAKAGLVEQNQLQAIVQAGTQWAGSGDVSAVHGFSGSWR